MGKVRFSILEKPPDRILREDMKFKGMTSRGAATELPDPGKGPFMGQQQLPNEESRSRLLVQQPQQPRGWEGRSIVDIVPWNDVTSPVTR